MSLPPSLFELRRTSRSCGLRDRPRVPQRLRASPHAAHLTARNISPLAKAAPTGQEIRRKSKQETPAENELTIKGKAYIAGIYEHPTRHAPDKSTAQLHAEVAKGAIEDAGLTKADIDGYFCAGDAPGGVMADGRLSRPRMKKLRHIDSTETGGCSYLIHLGHAAEAIAAGKCSIALVTLAGKPRTGPMPPRAAGAEADFETAYGADHPQCLRHVCHAPHARLRHHQRAARLDQGRGLASRAIQSARDAEGGRHRRGRAQLADDLRSPASDGLLRRHRRRRRA